MPDQTHIQTNFPGLTLRKARPEDGDTIRHLTARCYAEHGWTFRPSDWTEEHTREPHRWFRERSGDFWTLWDTNTLAATAAIKLHQRTAELKSLYVHPAYRRRGIGAALTRLAIDESMNRGARRFILWSDVALKDAHRLYLRFGMTPSGSRWVEAPEPYAEVGFHLELEEPDAAPT